VRVRGDIKDRSFILPAPGPIDHVPVHSYFTVIENAWALAPHHSSITKKTLFALLTKIHNDQDVEKGEKIVKLDESFIPIDRVLTPSVRK
jgi:hypothetical protein